MSPVTVAFKLVQRIEDAAVGAAGAEHGRPGGEAFGTRPSMRPRARASPLISAREPLERGTVQFADVQLGRVILDRDAHGADLLFEERVELLDDVEALHARWQTLMSLARQGISASELEDAGFGEDLAGVLVADAGGDEAEVGGPRLRRAGRARSPCRPRSFSISSSTRTRICRAYIGTGTVFWRSLV